MTAWYQNLQTKVMPEREIHFDFSQFVNENITRSWALTLWLIILTYLTFQVTFQQFSESPIVTAFVVVLWLVTVAITVFNEITRHHNSWTFWLKNNLYSSITNVELSLLLVLLIIAAVRGFFGYAITRASFTPDPEAAAANLAQFEQPGANWGAVLDNMRNLMVFRYPHDETWRIWATVIYVGILLIVSAVIFSQERFRGTWTRRILTIIWVLTPLITFGLLLGVGRPSGVMNPDVVWGGLLLTLIIAVFAIVASFPLGVLLALGRRSKIPGVPAWLTYGVAILLTAYFLYTATLPQLEKDTDFWRQIISFWPLIILFIAIAFQRTFNGNVVAAFSTLYIEVIRGVPLITVLFMSIILFPILLPKGTEVLSTWRVMVAAAMFAAAYLAENVRGGLQAIPKGQYEAADALGLKTFRKYWLIILPQAIRVVIPAIVGQFTGLFKDTTLIAIVGLIELLGVANLISAQPDWLGVRREPYIFLMVIYFVGSWIMVSSSRRMERNLGVGER
ncbi:MAG: amino acid ABC transporter permease [Candidatus Promineifilaceae bacterium]|jgi:general L-amino acid transport system permease protein